MKYLSDIEILNWNQRLQKGSYMVYPASNSQSSYPHIGFNRVSSPRHWGTEQLTETIDPVIRFDFTFSVIENRKDIFFDLLDKLFKEKFITKSVYKDKVSDIKCDQSIIESKDISVHKVLNRSYVRYTYHFSALLSSIMAYVSYMEDAINFFEKMWAYDEEGKEYCLLKYPVGSVVSKEEDKSSDFLVVDYLYEKLYDDYKIDYLASEIIDSPSVIIKYGNVIRFKEHELCFSRNNRIDDILN